jgi:rhamnogalacturonan endolyase
VTANVHDGATGSVLWSTHTFTGDADPDVGRGVAFDVDPRFPGYEAWDTYNPGIYNVATGTEVLPSRGNAFVNFGVWWDADPLRELEDGTTIADWNYTSGGRTNFDLDPATSGSQSFAPNASSNNGTKSTPCLAGDILGDWREEVVWRRSDNTALEIFTTTIATSTRYYTLMHDSQYREAIAWQNVGYNQPPHPGFFLGAADTNGTPSVAPTPNIYTAPSSGGLPPNSYQAELASFGGGTIAETTNPGYDVSGYVNFSDQRRV